MIKIEKRLDAQGRVKEKERVGGGGWEEKEGKEIEESQRE